MQTQGSQWDQLFPNKVSLWKDSVRFYSDEMSSVLYTC